MEVASSDLKKPQKTPAARSNRTLIPILQYLFISKYYKFEAEIFGPYLLQQNRLFLPLI